MKHVSSATLLILLIRPAAPGLAQTKVQAGQTNAAPSSGMDMEGNDVQVHISALDFRRDDVRQEKAQIMDGVMMPSTADAARFWTIAQRS